MNYRKRELAVLFSFWIVFILTSKVTETTILALVSNSKWLVESESINGLVQGFLIYPKVYNYNKICP